eukprot:CAMPEP_0197604792 /NCGR_PEP_ID=MMETSP1326-20131121/41873_1 /TAXON_ID=1155430 /ORGANISM="Genus nov. species nov., Strain RCC2288" /LENGTH=222 /DNA_ID=CAMNT_0043172505 /DNA_START=5 /DNA_END=669 /DNA_ORIENTATION=-
MAFYKYHVMVRRLLQADLPVIIPTSSVDRRAADNAWEGLMQAEVERDRAQGLHYKNHKCTSPLCGKFEVDGRLWKAIVLDGVQGMNFAVCHVKDCTNAPTMANARFCREHHHLNSVCAARVEDGVPDVFCQNVVVQGRLCCVDHQDLEAEFSIARGHYRSAPREIGEGMENMHQAEVAFFKERARHRFGIKYLQNFMFLVFTCGIIRSFHPQFAHEGDISTA